MAKYIKLIFILCVGLMLFSSSDASAAPANLKGLTLSPIKNEFEISPGTLQSGTLLVTNLTDKLMTVNFSAEEFSVINQQYDYAFTAESNIAKWVHFDMTLLTLQPGESKKVSYDVAVPLSAEPGGRYISLFASSETKSTDSGVSSMQRVASLLYFTVSGKVSRVGNLVSLTAPSVIGDKINWSAVIQNTGSTHFRSRYNVTVNDLFDFGLSVAMSGDALILPGTVRLLNDNIITPDAPGVYRAVFVIGLGDSPAKVETRYILYAPVWFNCLILAICFLLIFVFIKKHKSKQSTRNSA